MKQHTPRKSIFISRSKYFIVLFVLLLVSISGISADPFTGGKNSASAPAASRAPLIQLPAPLVNLQLEFREKAADILSELTDNRTSTTSLLFFIVVFIYGILHAAGPGHRKTVIFSLFLSRESRLWQPAAAGFLSAALHAGSSILLVVIFKYIIKTVSVFTSTSQASFYMEGWTFILLVLFAAVLIIFKIFEIHRGDSMSAEPGAGKGIYLIIFISSIFPCPGATMILLFALSQGLFLTGILGVAAMSAGMGIVISAAGYLALSGRKKLFLILKKEEEKLKKWGDRLELASYTFVAFFALWMGSPFINYLYAGR